MTHSAASFGCSIRGVFTPGSSASCSALRKAAKAFSRSTARPCGAPRAAAASPLHLVSAWAAEARLCLGQVAVDDKSNEIVAVPKLLDLLSLKGRIVTADAISCQRKIAQQVIDQGADYVLALKGNQETLHDDVRRFLDDPHTALTRATDTDKGHGRIETRSAALSTDIDWLQQSHHWPALAAIGKITATRRSIAKSRSRPAIICSQAR